MALMVSFGGICVPCVRDTCFALKTLRHTTAKVAPGSWILTDTLTSAVCPVGALVPLQPLQKHDKAISSRRTKVVLSTVLFCLVLAVCCGDYNIVPFTSPLSWCNIALIIVRNVLLLDGAIKTKIHC